MTKFSLSSLSRVEQTLILEVVEREDAADGVLALKFRAIDGSELPPWTPGAHIDLILPNGIVRQYSLCGDPADRHLWRIGVLLEPRSRGGSSYIHDRVQPGDRLTVSTPRNNFELERAGSYIFVAGGIGITPILAMVRAVTAAGKRWTLVYGGRSRSSMAFLEELAALSGGGIHILPQDEVGLIDLDYHLGFGEANTLVYCCGPAPLITAVENQCQTWVRGSLHIERFAPSEKALKREKGSFEVRLERSGKSLIVPPFRSLLDLLEENGCKVTNSCRAGICGTCLVKVISGTPEHNDDVLTDDEQASGEIMLVCVSRCKEGVLVLDL